MPKIFFLLTLLTLLLSVACNTKHEVQVAPVEVKPIHITIDVNIKVDRALDDFFGDLDAAAETSDENKVTK
ncbi:MAG: hypothetical protein U9N63_02330 [Pseudomonadota bacterium]|nr:hypothetical protein [Pseudomonadota bacterium]